MDRRSFTKLCGLLGISAAFPLNAALKLQLKNKRVGIIGAGAAGMCTGYLLKALGVEYTLFEASSRIGGRIKEENTFADFPLSLGAEWLHVAPSELDRIAQKPVNVRLSPYPKTAKVAYFEDGNLYEDEIGDYQDARFTNSSWLGFFEQYLLPEIKSNLLFDTEITQVNYADAGVVLTDSLQKHHNFDVVVVTVPLPILRNERLRFLPPLPDYKRDAINQAAFWGGIKVFIEFKNHFYPTFLTFLDSETDEGQYLYYDAAYGHKSSKHVMGLFAVGEHARRYQSLNDVDLINQILSELTPVFGEQVRNGYVKHTVQNWNEEPFVMGAYLADSASYRGPSKLFKPVKDKVFFAGEAYHTDEEDWGGVHNAARAARNVVEMLTHHKFI